MLKAMVPRPRANRRRFGFRGFGEGCPGLLERRLDAVLAVSAGSRASCFQSATTFRIMVADGGALDDLDELDLGEMGEQRAVGQCASDHTQQQHHAEQGDDFGVGVGGCEVGCEGEADGLGGVQAGADKQEREGRADLAEDDRAVGVAGQNDERERHDGEAAELDERSHPDVRHPPPAQNRPMGVGPEADEGSERGEHQGQRNHDRDEPGGDAEFDDHHAVEGADEQHDRETDGDLKQRQAQQAWQRQFRGRGVGERQEPRADPGPGPGEFCCDGGHWRAISNAWEM